MASPKLHNGIRKYHRWLGFFLAGILSIYAISGILLIFRKTDFLKYPYTETHQLASNLSASEVIESLQVKGLQVTSEYDSTVTLNIGEYSKLTGAATITKVDYPLPLAKLVKLHKATNNSPLFWLNISFGLALLFFVISAFLMFLPRTPMFKNGLKISALGALFALLVVVFAS